MTLATAAVPGAPRWWRSILAALLAALAASACQTSGGQDDAPAETGRAAEPAPRAFVVAETMLDTWNTIGQIVVNLEGVGYDGRSQMLGLYTLRYRGEAFLVRTQAIPADVDHPGVRTRVDALSMTGAPVLTEATAALLGILEQRVPVEAQRYRQPPGGWKTQASKKKTGSQEKARR